MMASCCFDLTALWGKERKMCTGAFDLLSVLQSCLLVVYWLTGQGKDPDLCHLPQHVFLVAAERQDLASLCRMLHHLSEVGKEREGRGRKK